MSVVRVLATLERGTRTVENSLTGHWLAAKTHFTSELGRHGRDARHHMPSCSTQIFLLKDQIFELIVKAGQKDKNASTRAWFIL